MSTHDAHGSNGNGSNGHARNGANGNNGTHAHAATEPLVAALPAEPAAPIHAPAAPPEGQPPAQEHAPEERLERPPPGTLLDELGRPAPLRAGQRTLLRSALAAPRAPIDHAAPALRAATERRRAALLVCEEGALTDEEYSTLALLDDLAAQETDAGAEPDVHVGGELRGSPFIGARCEPLQVFVGDAYGVARAVEKGLRTSIVGVRLGPEHLRAFSVRILAPDLEEGKRVRDLLATALPVGTLGQRPQFAWAIRVLPSLNRTLVSVWTDLARRELYDHAYHLYANPDFRALLDASEDARAATVS